MNALLCRPPVSDLVFQLYGRSLHPELFDVLAFRRLKHDSAEISIRITRTGHAITWCNDNVCLTEVAASGDELLPDRGRLFRHRLRGENQGSFSFPQRVSYQSSFQVEVLPPEIFLHVHDEILADGASRGLLHHFQPNQRLALAPLGFIAIEGRKNCLVVHAFHTFPQESTVVKSQSLIEVR